METIKSERTNDGGAEEVPAELRERAIRMTLDAWQDQASRPVACTRIAEQLGINAETLRGWVMQAEVEAGARPGTTTGDSAKLAELEWEKQELRLRAA